MTMRASLLLEDQSDAKKVKGDGEIIENCFKLPLVRSWTANLDALTTDY